MTDDSVHVAFHCDYEAISLLDDALVEETLETHTTGEFENGVRIAAYLLQPKVVVVVSDRETQHAGVALNGKLACRAWVFGKLSG